MVEVVVVVLGDGRREGWRVSLIQDVYVVFVGSFLNCVFQDVNRSVFKKKNRW